MTISAQRVLPRPDAPAGGWAHPTSRWLIWMGCLSLVPNPALQIVHLRLQAVNFALLLFIIFRSRLIQPRAVAAWMYLAIPAVTCAMFYLFAQLFATETLKLCALWLLGTVYIVPGTLRGESDLRALLQGISLGIILNLAISALQLITVPADAYPFWSWY